jgi:glutamine amidotransferase
MKNIKILNYGNGNIGSLINVFNFIGYPASVVTNYEQISKADLLVLPGVGSAVSSSFIFDDKALMEQLNSFNEKNNPILGVCLGAQLLFEYLEESNSNGFSWEKGIVKKMNFFNTGWSELNWAQLVNYKIHSGLKFNDCFYFNHGYMFPNSEEFIQKVVFDKSLTIPSIYFNDNLCGIQFHPEKSQLQGTKILKNILKIYYDI